MPETAINAAAAPAVSRQSILSPELVEWATKWIDFVAILFAAALAYAFYFALLTTPSEGATGRYILTALAAATFFRVGFRRVGGYTFRRLTDLRWQSARIAIVWGVTVAVLLLVAFV